MCTLHMLVHLREGREGGEEGRVRGREGREGSEGREGREGRERVICRSTMNTEPCTMKQHVQLNECRSA